MLVVLNQEKALVGAFSVIVKAMDHLLFAALLETGPRERAVSPCL